LTNILFRRKFPCEEGGRPVCKKGSNGRRKVPHYPTKNLSQIFQRFSSPDLFVGVLKKSNVKGGEEKEKTG
jgi:hypothetical protein